MSVKVICAIVRRYPIGRRAHCEETTPLGCLAIEGHVTSFSTTVLAKSTLLPDFDANHRNCTGRYNDPPEFPIPSPPSLTIFSRHDHSPHRCRNVVDEGLKLDIEHKEDSSDSHPQVRLGPYITNRLGCWHNYKAHLTVTLHLCIISLCRQLVY
jgi:hypothetical protein